ncbi:endolytic transglycosylase MltG [Gluconobacter wancherniae]|uniref:endolytic transglycosylase MltG n=1 Tax=Gluconobacter wancherniae TaxID=1307955 RepID=UPI001B8A9C5C|nr:endolytic transglycosylase MltG [Gluconobacter wancherniae]MBS1061568.1 endolytic transglycosylase MltG [Gluconobacter wancherniae]MBS1093667.1 endolytic transglycosylase MltG [Gluconobacter wancherniae]
MVVAPPEDGRKPLSFLALLKGGRAFFLLPLIALAGVAAGYGHYTDPGPLPKSEIFVIPHGNAARVTNALQEDGILSQTWSSGVFFRMAAYLTHRQGQIHAAELAFPAHVSMAHLLDILRHAQPVSHSLTVPEGLTAKRIAVIFQKAPVLHGDTPDLPEGSVFPQTISYVWGTTRASLVGRLQDLMKSHLQAVWDGRDQEALDGLINSPEELLTLASLIERETSVASERPQVARVFLNRLGLGMRLQTDPSVIYGLSNGLGTLDQPLTHDDLLVAGPYNTYLQSGLPPGPICSPGLSSLEAAAHPAAGKMLYFVATGHGGHNFAETLGEQNQNVRSYREVRSAPH